MLISEAYRKEQELLHSRGNYGVASKAFAAQVTALIDGLGVTEILDYGCGSHANLAKSITPSHEVTVNLYDPGVPEYSNAPDSSQLVTCIDVLEHIEPEYLDDVLDDLKRVTEFYGFFTVHTGPAVKVLSDGRNAHLIQEPPAWWLPKIMARFDLQQFQKRPDGFIVLVKPYVD